jgi:hypothetical protein
MPPFIRVLVGDIIGTLVAGLATWLGGKGINVNAESREFLVASGITVFTIVFTLIKAWVNSHFNPANVSSPKMATQIHADMKEEEAQKNGSS